MTCNDEADLLKLGKRLPPNTQMPMSNNYRPKLAVSPELSSPQFYTYQQLIVILSWMVELSRIDIHLLVSLLAQHLALSRMGHLDQVYHMFAFLKAHHCSCIILDDTVPHIDEAHFPKVDWKEFYPDAVEAIPSSAPEPLDNPVTLSCFVDADHAWNQVTRCSHTGIIIFYNRAPIIWFSKQQNTVETSTFGS